MDDTTPTNVSYKLTRSAGGLWERLQVYWQKKWFRWASYLVGASAAGLPIAMGGAAAQFA